jgi:hypothetical protein
MLQLVTITAGVATQELHAVMQDNGSCVCHESQHQAEQDWGRPLLLSVMSS